jgi:hypothetical protein
LFLEPFRGELGDAVAGLHGDSFLPGLVFGDGA